MKHFREFAIFEFTEEIASPEWHRDVLADRKARAQLGEVKFLPLDQLRERLRGSGSVPNEVN